MSDSFLYLAITVQYICTRPLPCHRNNMQLCYSNQTTIVNK